MKKIFYVTSLVSALVLVSGVALAATTAPAVTKTVPAAAKTVAQTTVKYTTEQQACIKIAQDKRSADMKVATDALNNATKAALQARQDAIKAAQDAFSAATKDQLKVEQSAIIAAQKSKDVKARSDQAKAANDAYNNNKTVQQAKIPYMAAIKTANDQYNNAATVKQAKAPYIAAVKAVNDKFQSSLKACLSPASHPVSGFFQKIGSGISNSFSGIINFFTGKK